MGQKFQCPQCDYETSRKSTIVQKSVHMGQKFQCPECEYKDARKSNVITHHKSEHMGKQ